MIAFINTDPKVPRTVQVIRLGSTEYQVTFDWRERLGMWLVSLTENSTGAPVVSGVTLEEWKEVAVLPDGAVWTLPVGDTQYILEEGELKVKPYTRMDLGERLRLAYVTGDHLTSFRQWNAGVVEEPAEVVLP